MGVLATGSWHVLDRVDFPFQRACSVRSCRCLASTTSHAALAEKEGAVVLFDGGFCFFGGTIWQAGQMCHEAVVVDHADAANGTSLLYHPTFNWRVKIVFRVGNAKLTERRS